MSRQLGTFTFIAMLATVGLACSSGEAEAAPPKKPAAQAAAAKPAGPAGNGITPSAAAMEEAKTAYAARCTACHGPRGAGDGPTAAALKPAPRNLQDPAWQKSVTDGQIEKVIVEGGGAIGKSPMMPPAPDLKTKPEVVAAMRDLIRGFSK